MSDVPRWADESVSRVYTLVPEDAPDPLYAPYTRTPSGKTERYEGPGTGLPWGVETARQNLLGFAARADRQMDDFERDSFGRGLCMGQAAAYREAAAALIRYAWWALDAPGADR